MRNHLIINFIALFFTTQALLAQPGAGGPPPIRGTVLDAKDNSPLAGVSVTLWGLKDSSKIAGVTTNEEGRFAFRKLPEGQFRLQFSYLGFQTLERQVTLDPILRERLEIKLEEDANLLKEAKIVEKQNRIEQKGDTTQYNAAAYKTERNASVEDLVQKMPGLTVENGVVKSQGEEVKKVTVDGREFFGDDATLALRNLPAEVVEKIQVYERLSEQAQFTGFDDGSGQKSINIVTRKGMANGQFGKVYGSYGTDNRYLAGGNLNFFKGKRRISIIGLANNVNQQNFSQQDLLGVATPEGGDRGGGNRGMGFGGPGGGRGGGGRGGGGNWGQQQVGSSSDYMVGQQGGISGVGSFGVNFSDKWGKKWQTNASYFFNRTDNDRQADLLREYFFDPENSQFYSENSLSSSLNFNHRLNAKIEFSPDTANTFTFSPRFSFQDNTSASEISGENFFQNGDPLNSTDFSQRAGNQGFTLNSDFLYRHKFKKSGRTVSLNLGHNINEKEGSGKLLSRTEYFSGADSLELLDQISATQSKGSTSTANLTFTEPIGKKGQLSLTYNPSLNVSNSLKETHAFDSLSMIYSKFESRLSSDFDNEIFTNRGGLSYRWNSGIFNFSAGANFQTVEMTSQQVWPTAFSVDKKFQNILPNAMLQFRFSKNENLRLNYRTYNQTPSVSQLQNVVDNSNPLILSTGNENLEQQFTHSFSGRYNKTSPKKATSLMVFGWMGFTQNYIANGSFIAFKDTVLPDGIALQRGAQLTRPFNLNGQQNGRIFLNYGMPLSKIKCNLNLNAGFVHQKIPGLTNGQETLTTTSNPSGGFVLSSNISEKMDFTASYSANYNIAKNTLQPELDNNYFFHTAGLRASWQFWRGFFVGSEINQTFYDGLEEGVDQNFLLWNAAVGYRFFEKETLEIKLSAFDLLQQNNSISRTVTETYVEDNVTKVLRQYFLLTATYYLRKFPNKPQN